MLKKLAVLALVLGAGFSLVGCAGTGSATFQSDVANIEAAVQADANVLCGFVPTAATIAGFIPGFGTVAASAATIAEGVCSAVSSAPVVKQSARRLGAVGVNAPDTPLGVVNTPAGQVQIVGHFTR